jgi:predicted tellurium resistance membrane protein TerC
VGMLENVARVARVLRRPMEAKEAAGAVAGTNAEGKPRKTLVQATWQIIVADVSMSLDNVLAVAGAAREHPVVMIFGLALSIAMMAWRLPSLRAFCKIIDGLLTSA